MNKALGFLLSGLVHGLLIWLYFPLSAEKPEPIEPPKLIPLELAQFVPEPEPEPLKLLDDTEMDHTWWLEKQLGLIDKIGLQNYLQSQM